MAPDAPTIGMSDVGIGQRLRGGRAHAPEEVEDEVAPVPHRVLDVVAEDPEKEHVARRGGPRLGRA